MNDQTPMMTRRLSADELAAIGFMPLKTQAEIDGESLAEFIEAVERFASRAVFAVAALIAVAGLMWMALAP